ncbi:BrnT family toxin [Mesorhizobium opportunistum]|uniref:BrnT family toxin n=1 Tax=Mesorhizobium opportunistum TaxID=593909 RepID=A0ABV1YFN6_9HYPH|nr:BrnT family toxin [Mesorhizobium sp.]TJV17127.1 MAG: BrnT family toxin [Mesorhizobium sp.]TJV42997.1 MAG: BrnT family toxin [Mesorhizobium sp.]
MEELRFEWDLEKASSNLRKHGVSFETAVSIFSDPFALTEQDRVEDGEYRWQTTGAVDDMLVLLIAHVDREEDGMEVIRIISARRATTREKKRYAQNRSI